MKTRKRSFIYSAILMGLILNSGASIAHENMSRGESNQKAIDIVNKLATSMGGVSILRDIISQKIESSIQRFEPQQTFKPGSKSLHTTDIQRTLTSDFVNPRTTTNWHLNSFYPTFDQFTFTEIINGNHGAILGVDGLFSPPNATMRSTRIGTRTKQYFLSSPLALIRWALKHKSQLVYRGKDNLGHKTVDVVSIPGLEQPINLYIEKKHHLLLKVSTVEDDTIYGDANWEITFSDWKIFDGIHLPVKLVHTLNSRIVSIENRSDIKINTMVNDAMFTIDSELLSPFNERQFKWGLRSSQWFTRLLSLGIPFDIDQTLPELVNFAEIYPNVFHILGATHNSLLIEMDEYLIIVDPVLYDDRTQEIIRQISLRWPEKPIQYVIASHFHHDHIGGIRGYAELGASIIVGDDTEHHYEHILDAAHTIYPDAYSKNQVDVNIITVDEDEPYVLTDGNRTVQVFDIANRHAKGMLVPYIEDAKIIFTSDLYNPGNPFGSPIPAQFDKWALDLFDSLQPHNLDIETIVGAHGRDSSYDDFVSDIELLR